MNDDCIDAIPIFEGLTAFDTTTATTDGPADPGCELGGDGGQTFNDIWYTYTPAEDGLVYVSTCEDIGGTADYDTDLVIYSGTCGALNLLECNDDNPGYACGAAPLFHSTVSVLVEAGETYLIRVGGWNTTDSGTGELSVELIPEWGACCLPGGCDVMPPADCAALGGTYQGPFSGCLASDSDGDGIGDARDLCPDDPNKVAPGDCGCGSPDQLIGAAFDLTFGVFGGGVNNFNFPRNVDVDAGGRIFVADTFNSRIVTYDSTGTWQDNIFSGISQPSDVALGIEGYLYVADTNNDRIRVVATDGTVQFDFGTAGAGAGEFNEPTGVAQAAGGTVAVADRLNHRIQLFSYDGNHFATIGGIAPGTGDGEFASPWGVDIDKDGRILVADTDNNRIQVFDSAGTFLFKFGSAGSGDGQFSGPRSIGSDSAGNIIVPDAGNNRVQVFDPNGNFLYAFGSAGSGDGEFSSPEGIGVDRLGRIHVADTVNHRIQIFDPVAECVGGCCLPLGCMQLTSDACADRGGTYLGDGSACTDADTDGDGMPDACDGCPNDPIKIAPGDCGCGEVPDRIGAAFDFTFGSLGTGNGQFFGASGLAIDAAGRMYVGDLNNDRVQVFDNTGVFLFAFTNPTADMTPESIAVDARGRVYVADSNFGGIQVFDGEGGFLFAFSTNPSRGIDPITWGVAVDAAGRIYVTTIDPLGEDPIPVRVYDDAGNFLFDIDVECSDFGFGCGPSGIAVDAIGRIYVGVEDIPDATVQVFDNAGNFLFSFVAPFSSSMFVDAAGRIYTGGADDRIRMYDTTGTFLFEFGTFGSAAGQFSNPRGIAVDAAGRIYVADRDNSRVQILDTLDECRGACCLSELDAVYVGATECANLGGTFLGEGVAATSSLGTVADPGFEGGSPNASWTETSTNFGTPLCDSACGGSPWYVPHTGNWHAWFGGAGTNFEEATLEQSVTIPSEASRLSFRLQVPLATRNGDDYMAVLIDGIEQFRIQPGGSSAVCGNGIVEPGEGCDDGNTTSGDGCDANCQIEGGRGGPGVFIADETLYVLDYQEVVIDLIDAIGGPYNDGGSHTIRFESVMTGVGGSTNFFVDDVIIGNTPCIDCPGDANGDLVVDLADLLLVIGNWGGDGSGGGDVNDDNSVDLADLLAVIGNWGSAC